MALDWTYFLLLQAVVLVVFYVKRNNKEDFVLSKLFPTKIHFLVANICVFLNCFFYNTERQLFCIPVPWAATVIILFCISFLVFPFINQRAKFFSIVAAVCGFGFFLAVYLLLFARGEYLIFVVLNIPIILILHSITRIVKREYHTNVLDAFYFYPAIVLTPFFLFLQLWILLKGLKTNTQKRLFVATPVLSLVVCLLLTIQMKHIIDRISVATDQEKELKEIVANPVNYYLTELILGAHWKYHTELCLFDGWRPPFHDPVLVVANKVLHPFSYFYEVTDWSNAAMLYKAIYPNKPTTFDCKCATNETLFDL